MVELIDPQVFSINKNCKVSEKYIGKSNNKLIIVDNFFLFPNQVREYALSCSYAKEGDHANPGYIHRTGFNMFQYLDFTRWVKETYYQDYRTIDYSPIFSFQAYDSIEIVIPHIDEVNYAGLCCLNTDEEVAGDISGTSFYRYKTGEEHTHPYSYRTEILKSSNLKDWNKYHTEYHQYNRFIFYESCLFHSAYWNQKQWASEHPRLTFNTFTW